jgi:nitrite reductase/ring-hydroxylating ferredoxin subunit
MTKRSFLDMSNDSTSRRRFLGVVARGGAVASAACLGINCGSGTSISGTYSGGNVSALAVGDLTPISGGPLAIGRDSGGVYAMSLICTHASCDMSSQGSVSASGVRCFCHGSSFDVDGNVTGGPARGPLVHYEVTVDAAGEITINGDVTVTETTRTPA